MKASDIRIEPIDCKISPQMQGIIDEMKNAEEVMTTILMIPKEYKRSSKYQ